MKRATVHVWSGRRSKVYDYVYCIRVTLTRPSCHHVIVWPWWYVRRARVRGRFESFSVEKTSRIKQYNGDNSNNNANNASTRERTGILILFLYLNRYEYGNFYEYESMRFPLAIARIIHSRSVIIILYSRDIVREWFTRTVAMNRRQTERQLS